MYCEPMIPNAQKTPQTNGLRSFSFYYANVYALILDNSPPIFFFKSPIKDISSSFALALPHDGQQ